MPTIKEIVREYLEKNGYGGLQGEHDDCGCYLDDLFPRGEPGEDCRAAYVIKCKNKDSDEIVCGSILCDGDCDRCSGLVLSTEKEDES